MGYGPGRPCGELVFQGRRKVRGDWCATGTCGALTGVGTNAGVDELAFEAFVADLQPRLVGAFVPLRGVDGAADAAAEAMAYAFEHWDRVQGMENPSGYLYRVGQSRTRDHASS